MKVAILCLFAMIAVSQAAFTVNLQQRAQPILARAFAQSRLRVRSDSELQTTIFQTLQEHANSILESLSSGVATFSQVYDDFIATINALTELGGNAVDAATEMMGTFLSNMWNNLWGSRNVRALDFSQIVSFLQTLDIPSMLLQGVAQLISSLGVPQMIESAMSAIFSNEIVQQIMSFVLGNKRGLFGDLISGIVSGVSGAANALAQNVAQIISNVQGALEEAMPQIQAIAWEMVSQAQSQLGELSQAAIDQMMAALAPFAEQMNGAYEAMVAVIQSLVGNKRF